MVSFICDACGQTIKKNRVEKHYQQECRSCSVLSCIDCGTDFVGDDYAKHTSCLTEAEKYQGKLYKAKDKSNKGEVKQQNWIKQVQGISGSTKDPKLKEMLARISGYSNVPRKQTKFVNFCKNSLRCYNEKLLNCLWELFIQATSNEDTSKEKKKPQSKQKENVNGHEITDNSSTTMTDNATAKVTTNLNADIDASCKNAKIGKKRKREKRENGDVCIPEKLPNTDAEITENCTTKEEVKALEETAPKGKFHWQKAIKSVLRSCGDEEISLKKLRKKVIAEYQNHGMDHRAATLEECYALFDKKFKGYPKAKIVGNRVKFCQT